MFSWTNCALLFFFDFFFPNNVFCNLICFPDMPKEYISARSRDDEERELMFTEMEAVCEVYDYGSQLLIA